MKNKKVWKIVIIIIALILLFPIPLRLKDGGSIEFKAILYSVTKYHQLNLEVDGGYVNGIGIEILGAKILDTRTRKTETITATEERTKLKDLKIKAEGTDITKLVKFDDKLYGKSYALIDWTGDLNKSIGKIDYLIENEYLPIIDGETNTEEFYEANVIEANEKTMVLNVNNVAVLFNKIDNENIKKLNGELLFEKCGEDEETTIQTQNSFVGTVLEETTTYMIVEPNVDEEERKSADKIRVNYGVEHSDYLYGIGRKVIINYTGYIKETYPAQIDTDNILTNGYEEFELSVKKSNDKKKTKILNNQELYKNNSDFNLYYYGLEEVNVFVDNKTMSLEEALKTGKMTIEGILAKANKDVSDGIIREERYKDGGTAEWYYEDYTIIKRHSLDGNRDVYIGIQEMRLNNIK